MKELLMRDKRVYIAGPYTSSDPAGLYLIGEATNVGNAIAIAEEILNRTNWLPFVPHLFHLWQLVYPHPYDFWMAMDLDWMQTCHALLQVHGKPEGGDMDMHQAIDLGIPVFVNLDEFCRWTREEA